MPAAEQVIHIYDHEKACIYLESGRVVRLRNSPFKEADEALEPLTQLARQKGLIASGDVVATFSA